jgi:hypothetical protein
MDRIELKQRAAIAAMQALVTASSNASYGGNAVEVAKDAVVYAEALTEAMTEPVEPTGA